MMHFSVGGKTVLIIDDNLNNLKVASEFLASAGLEVMMARNGADGVERAEKGQPDLILLDVLMPDMDGYSTCKALKDSTATRNIPVLFLSALDEVGDKLKGFVVGGLDFITKPIDEAELLARVSTHLQLAHLHAQLSERNDRLIDAVDDGKIVNVVVGILMERYRLDQQEAFDLIRSQARARRVKVRVVAQDLMENIDQLNFAIHK